MKKERIVANVFFWLTLVSPIVAFTLASYIGESDVFGIAGILRYIWVMWLFVPIGILSVLAGKKQKKNRRPCRKNYIVAFVCIPLLLLFGSYRFVFSEMVSYDKDTLVAVEQIVGVSFPDEIKIATMKMDSYQHGTYSVSYVRLTDEEEANIFEQKLASDVLWKESISSQIRLLLPIDIQVSMDTFDRFLFYNATQHQYNEYPSVGTHTCVFMAYDYELQRCIVLDGMTVVLD